MAYSNIEVNRSYNRNYHSELKSEVLTHYSGGLVPRCVFCGESRLACLSIDHIEGGGSRHRRELGLRPNGFYRWLRKGGYPKGYQTLCMNCQFVKAALENENRWRK